MVILHYIIRFFHTKLLIKWNSIFIGYQIHRNILFTTRLFMRNFHKLPSNSLTFIISIYP